MNTKEKNEAIKKRCLLANKLLNTSASYLIKTIKDRAVTSIKTGVKPGTSPLVTEADESVEKIFKDAIKKKFPNDLFLGEETGESTPSNNTDENSFRWVVDPIDGTSQFARGIIGNWGILVAILNSSNEVVVGFMDSPRVGERWSAILNEPTQLNDFKVINKYKSSDLKLSNCILASTSPDIYASDYEKETFAKLSKTTGKRVFGGDCSNYVATISSPFVPTIVCEATLNAWDILALKIIVENAGGLITDWLGNAISTETTQVLVAPCKSLLEQMLECIKQ